MNKIIKTIALCFASLSLLHFGSQDESIVGHHKPTINFYGKITDTSGQEYQVENITISGMYKQIPLYQKPTKKNIDPTINITRIDFAEIYSIHVPHPEVTLIFNNRNYIEVEITSADLKRTKQSYIIEQSKRVICDQVNSAGAIEKDLAFQAINILIFEGHKSAMPATKKAANSN